jgi:hypothetical protein
MVIFLATFVGVAGLAQLDLPLASGRPAMPGAHVARALQQNDASGSSAPVMRLTVPGTSKISGAHDSPYLMLKTVTAAALLTTAMFGTVVALNQPTAFGDGRCAKGNPVFRSYGCSSLSTLHGMGAVVSFASYTATETLRLAVRPNPPATAATRWPVSYRALSLLHLGGILVQPVLGILSRFPDVIGVDSKGSFPRNARTVHVGLGYLTVLSYAATLIMEL